MEDLVSAHVRFDGGLSLQMDGSWCAEEGDSSGFEIVCEKGTMTCGPLKVWVEGADGQVVDETPNLAGVEFARRRVYSLTDSVRANQMPEADADFLDAWMRSIQAQDADVVQKVQRGDGPDMQDRRQLLNLQRLIDACYESARRGREVDAVGTR